MPFLRVTFCLKIMLFPEFGNSCYFRIPIPWQENIYLAKLQVQIAVLLKKFKFLQVTSLLLANKLKVDTTLGQPFGCISYLIFLRNRKEIKRQKSFHFKKILTYKVII